MTCSSWTDFNRQLPKFSSDCISKLPIKNRFAGIWQGSLTNDALDDYYEITFTNEYEYQGGNLLIGIYRTEKGNYKDATFKGKSVTGASLANYSSSISKTGVAE